MRKQDSMSVEQLSLLALLKVVHAMKFGSADAEVLADIENLNSWIGGLSNQERLNELGEEVNACWGDGIRIRVPAAEDLPWLYARLDRSLDDFA
jgi:hypothetical protein